MRSIIFLQHNYHLAKFEGSILSRLWNRAALQNCNSPIETELWKTYGVIIIYLIGDCRKWGGGGTIKTYDSRKGEQLIFYNPKG